MKIKVSKEAFNITYDALRNGHFSWRKSRKSESAAEYLEKRDQAIHSLCHILQSSDT
jgi:hypothetical protein